MKSPALAVLLILLALTAGAEEKPSPPDAVSLSELAAASDLVVLAQTRDTDYRMRRDIPVSGSAYLKVLIPYKTDRELDLVEVYEMGLHEDECYFPNPTVFEEGRRYLLFLRRDPENPERYRGMPQGCALEVLVDSDNRYAVRFPADGVRHTDDLSGIAVPLSFADGYSIVTDEALQPAKRNAMKDAGQIVPHGEDAWRYTSGIPLSDLRRLIGREALED